MTAIKTEVLDARGFPVFAADVPQEAIHFDAPPKLAAAFAGKSRLRLVSLLDHVGLHWRLGLRSSEELFGEARDLLQATSPFQFPVFNKGENFRGRETSERDPMLRLQMRDHFGKMVKAMPDALFIPTGAATSKGVEWLTKEDFPKKERVFHGPSPSEQRGQQAHCIFLGEEERADLSEHTNAEKVDAARDNLREAVGGTELSTLAC